MRATHILLIGLNLLCVLHWCKRDSAAAPQGMARKSVAAGGVRRKLVVKAAPLKSRVHIAPTLPVPIAAAANDALAVVTGARTLFRRDTDHQVDRCIQLKLSMYPRQQLEGNLNGAGKNIAHSIKLEIYRLRPSKRHIALQFWKNLIVEHVLCGSLVEGLAKPPNVEEVAKYFGIAIAEAHNENPAKRSATKMLRFLEHVQQLNQTEVYGLLKASVESPSCSARMSEVLLEHMIEAWARHSLRDRFPQYHEVCKENFDFTMARLWKKAQGSRIPRKNWIVAKSDALSLFLDVAQALAIEECVQRKEDPSPAVVSAISKSTVGSELFSPEMMKAEFKQFLTYIDEKVRGLEDFHFESSEVAAFKMVMKKYVEHMNDGFCEYDEASTAVGFLKCDVVYSAACIDDQWEWRMIARAVTIAVSNNEVPRLPWEVLVFGKSDPIPGVPTTVKIPPSMILKVKNVREVVCQHLGEAWQSLAQMKAQAAKHSTEWNKLCSSWWLVEKWLHDHADEMLESHLKLCLLEVLPRTGEAQCMSKALVAARALSTGPACMAACKATEREISAAVNLLQDMVDGRSPAKVDLQKMSTFAVTFVMRCEAFCHIMPGQEFGRGCTDAKKKLFGKDAINFRYELCSKNEEAVKPSDLKTFRTFRWLLDEIQVRQCDEWLSSAMVAARVRLQMGNRHAALEDVNGQGSGSGTSSGSSIANEMKKKRGSRASLVVESALSKVAKIDDLEEKKDDEKDEEVLISTSLSSFFGTKAWSAS